MMDRLKRALPFVGYGAFYFVVFFISCYFTFPYERLRDRLVAEFASEQKGKGPSQQRISIESLEPYWLTGVRAHGVKLTMSSAKIAADEPPTEIELEEVRARVGIFAKIFGTTKVTFFARAFGGEIDGTFADGSADRRLEATLKDVSIGRIEPIVHLVGLPLVGAMSGKIDLQFADKRVSKADGSLSLDVVDVSVGDGQAKLRGALALPKMNVGELTVDIDVHEGQAKINKLAASGTDLEMAGEGKLQLRDQASDSMSDIFLRFKFKDAYKNRNDITRMLFGAAGSPGPALFELDPQVKQSKRPDGFYGWHMTGMLSNARFEPSSGGSPSGPIMPPARATAIPTGGMRPPSAN